MPFWLSRAMIVVDLGFLVYWLAILSPAVPAHLMFAEYTVPQVAAWNWSFLPLDVAASATGLAGLHMMRRAARVPLLVVVSLVLTATAGGMALAYWALRGQFDPMWWILNGGLLAVGVTGLVVVGRDWSAGWNPPGSPRSGSDPPGRPARI